MSNVSGSTTFDDVLEHWTKTCIEALAQRQIVVGYPDGKFRPDSPVTRAEFAAMLSKAFPNSARTRDAIQFNDVPTEHWAYEAIRTAYETEFLKGYPDQTFKPNEPIARSEALITLVNGLKYSSIWIGGFEIDRIFEDTINASFSEAANEAIATATEKWMVVNYPNVRFLRPKEPATRAETAAFLCQALAEVGSLPTLLVPSQYIAGKSIIQRNDDEETIKVSTQDIRLNPNDAQAYYKRGLVHSSLGAEREAIEDYIKALLIAPDIVRRFWYASPNRPTEDYIQILQTIPEDAEAYYERGVVRYYLTDYEGAYRDFTRAIQLNPNFAEAYYMRGCSRLPFNPRWDEAEADLSQAIQLNPNLIVAYNKRGIIRRHFTKNRSPKDDEKGLADFNFAKELESPSAEDFYSSEIIQQFQLYPELSSMFGTEDKINNRIDELLGSNGKLKAIDAYTKAIHLNPLYDLGDFKNSLRSCIDPQDGEKAILSYTQAIQQNISNNNATTYFLRGLAYYDSGEIQAAIDDYSQAIGTAGLDNPKSANFYFNRGIAYYRLKNYQEAIADYTKVITLGSEDVDSYVVRGLAHYDAGNLQQAIDDLNLAVELNEQKTKGRDWPLEYYDISFNAYLIRAHAYNDIGNRPKAEEDYRRLFSLPPNRMDHPLAWRVAALIFYDNPGGASSFRYQQHNTSSTDKKVKRRTT